MEGQNAGCAALNLPLLGGRNAAAVMVDRGIIYDKSACNLSTMFATAMRHCRRCAYNLFDEYDQEVKGGLSTAAATGEQQHMAADDGVSAAYRRSCRLAEIYRHFFWIAYLGA